MRAVLTACTLRIGNTLAALLVARSIVHSLTDTCIDSLFRSIAFRWGPDSSNS